MHHPLTAADIKQSNKIRILQYVRNSAEVTKPEIAKELGISRPTVSALVDELISEGFLKISGIGTSTVQGGKRPKLISFNSGRAGVISIHIGVDTIDGALLDLDANILFRIREKTKSHEGTQKLLDRILHCIGELFHRGKGCQLPVLGIGVGCPGVVESGSGTILNAINFHILNNLRIGEILSETFRCSVWVDNECRNLALAERWFGLGRDYRTFISLLTDVGIGAGIIIDNQIIRGVDNSFGEIGHAIIDPDGPVCRCGNQGCWETFASSSALLNMVNQRLEDTVLLKTWSEKGELTVPLVAEAIKRGDQAAKQIAIYDLGKYLGIGIANMVNIFNPEVVFIHGEISALGEELIEQIEKWVHKTALSAPAARAKILYSRLGNNAHIIGAGALAIKELFDNPEQLFARN